MNGFHESNLIKAILSFSFVLRLTANTRKMMTPWNTLKKFMSWKQMNNGFSSAVERMPCDQEVASSNPAGCSFCISSLSFSIS